MRRKVPAKPVVRIGALIAAGSVLAACSGPGAGPSPLGSSTPASTAGPSVVAAEDCPTGTGEPALPAASSLFRKPELIADYLNAGGDLDRLLETLTSGGLLPVHPQAWPAALEDLDGDGRVDLAVSLQDLSPPMAPRPPGSLFIWLCREGGYALFFRSPPEADHSAPVVLAAADLTGDEASEVVFGRPVCGAHTCYLAVGVLEWDGEGFVDRWRGSSEDLPTPQVIVRIPSSSSPASISITSGGVQSVGAGPPRALTRRWIWSQVSGAFVPDTESLASPIYRIHMVHDADRTFLEGHFPQAERFYIQALEDPALLDWGDDSGTGDSLDGYIRFRMVLNALAQSQTERAQSALDSLAEASVGSPEAEPYLELAEILLTGYQESLDLTSACVGVREFAAANTAAILDPLYYGYDNPVYTAEDLCPVV